MGDQRVTSIYPSIALVAAGASGFFNLIQSGERPDRYGRCLPVDSVIPASRGRTEMCWGTSNNTTVVLNDTARRCELCEGRAAGKSEAPAPCRSAGQDRRPKRNCPTDVRGLRISLQWATDGIARRVESKATRPAPMARIYVFQCTVCDKEFERKTYDAALRSHKNRSGCDCYGRIGIHVRTKY
jgi:hypothetical protein